MSEKQKVRCVKISRPETSGSLWALRQLNATGILQDEFDGAEVGERIEVEYCELTQEEFDALPEFEGW